MGLSGRTIGELSGLTTQQLSGDTLNNSKRVIWDPVTSNTYQIPYTGGTEFMTRIGTLGSPQLLSNGINTLLNYTNILSNESYGTGNNILITGSTSFVNNSGREQMWEVKAFVTYDSNNTSGTRATFITKNADDTSTTGRVGQVVSLPTTGDGTTHLVSCTVLMKPLDFIRVYAYATFDTSISNFLRIGDDVSGMARGYSNRITINTGI
jgi:hypothetical protein